ncbi:MAG: tRNA glutamyl-Q(34) synthetase GluQRS [Gammaproteobacteria bacterium]|nr:tRNA glutamyl-Q(34) synthetase GluQRS [Gammaproteobacteria bacterium]
MLSSDLQPRYRGRFAPSPTGPLHFGSLVSAVASFLQAKSQHGVWLLRIEDLDPPREQAGAADQILRTLDNYGLQWDESVVYQSQRHERYETLLAQLAHSKESFPCFCSRKELSTAMRRANVLTYPGNCRHLNTDINKPHAIRLKVNTTTITFHDKIHGKISQQLDEVVGDFIIKRSDGFYAYQLAVVIDDADQGITEVVRGCDLLDNSPRQIYLQQRLGLPQPDYVHVPIVTNVQHVKLSKQTFAPPLDRQTPHIELFNVLQFLGQKPPIELIQSDLNSVWSWAKQYWNLTNIPKIHSKVANPQDRLTDT